MSGPNKTKRIYKSGAEKAKEKKENERKVKKIVDKMPPLSTFFVQKCDSNSGSISGRTSTTNKRITVFCIN